MPDTFPGLKILTLGPVFKGIGTIERARCTIPASRISGPQPEIYMRTSTSVDWEACNNGEGHDFTNTGTELYVMLIGSGTVLSTSGSAGEIVPCIFVKVTRVS